jgi:glycine cleavage system H lipoate-binding protein
MQAITNALQTIGIFLLYLVARFAVLLVVMAVLTVIFVAGLAVVRLAERARRHAMGLSRIDGLMWRSGIYFAPGHAWLQAREAGALRIGLDDLAQHVLARITEVILPEPGQFVRAGETAAVIRCGKRCAVIPAPVAGRVMAINRRVVSHPARLHNDPYGRGWLYAVKPEDTAYARLPYGHDSRAWFSREAVRLSQFFEHQLGTAAADGGELVAPAPSLLTEAQWAEMTKSFLQACR